MITEFTPNNLGTTLDEVGLFVEQGLGLRELVKEATSTEDAGGGVSVKWAYTS